MTPESRLGQAFRRLAANSSIRRVRRHDEARTERNGATSVELNARFRDHVATVEAIAAADEI